MDLLGAAPFAVVSAAITYVGQAWAYRGKVAKDRVSQADRLEIHRDKLTFELLQNARTEMASAHSEMEELRSEVKTLRSLEVHFFHFQQSLDHLDAVLFAPNQDARDSAERNAKAFLTRMRRLKDAKGTIRNEVQIKESQSALAEKGIIEVKDFPE